MRKTPRFSMGRDEIVLVLVALTFGLLGVVVHLMTVIEFR